MKRFLSLSLILALVIILAAGCGGGGSADQAEPGKKANVTLQFFTGKVETVDLMNELIAKFEAENPGIEVEQEFQKDASNVFKVKLASGDVPDITTVVSQEYIDQGQYLDLSDEPFWPRVLPSIQELTADVKTGKHYKAASNVTMGGIFYNKQLFDELNLKPANTWEEFKANLAVIKEKRPDVVPLFLAGKESWTLGQLVEFVAHGPVKQEKGVLEAKKAFINNDESQLQFGEPQGAMDMFAQRLTELKDEGLINGDAITATYDNQKEAFVQGKAAMIIQGMWVMGDLLKMAPDFQDNIGFAAIPSVVDGLKPVVLSAEDSAYAITAESKHPEEAKKFLDFLFQPENLKIYSEALKSPAAFTDVDADWGPLKDAAAQALESSAAIAFTDWPSGFSGDDAGRMVQELLVGKYKSSLEFAQAFQDTWNKAWQANNR
ncbi:MULTISPECIES: ABC transporter substrate-binding protein [unclassified Paenibacillus]|uniref:ABC transporter substrate-binding protein n=1 Tax=unclassified Paenibacillus TaxID=185978 RepID=UPI001C11EC89|nr:MULTISPECIES: extracellular solute-binding protein [unclassified Paenibacillus]MBU5442569.1 extracellular solute-binding protein [Paenibacillus sp. MSJ-34]CAH0120653.1 Multiple sugar-binding protein [Paenibacillus sp. CECT 9249]